MAKRKCELMRNRQHLAMSRVQKRPKFDDEDIAGNSKDEDGDEEDENGDAEENEFDDQEQVHVCMETCKRKCPFGGAGYPHWCVTCQLHTENGKVSCQRCACKAKPHTPFKDRLGGTCSAWVLGRKCQC